MRKFFGFGGNMRRKIKREMISALKDERIVRVPKVDLHISPSGTDPMGNYTGLPTIDSEPEQDVDDL